MTPSEEVDQAWHLHLVYSFSYWKDMGGEILGRELHHLPTEGGLAQAGKFVRQHEETLGSYEKLFGESPPHRKSGLHRVRDFNPRRTAGSTPKNTFLFPNRAFSEKDRFMPASR